MLRGLYTAASGMVAQAYRQDVITNNLANTNTSGYKRDTATVRSFPEMLISRIHDTRPDALIGYVGTGSVLDGTYTEFTPGSLKQTDNPLDLALSGPGFFTVALENGLAYTRAGAFAISAQGYLVDAEGRRVQGLNGDIKLDPNEPVRVTREGMIIQNGREVDRLLLSAPLLNNTMNKLADNLFVSEDPDLPEAEAGEVLSGFIETSNVKAVREMMDLMASFRVYEACQKAVQATDETLGKAVNEVGRTY